jgi:peptidoglycan/LPS O-acetylase OafA/YrhL
MPSLETKRENNLDTIRLVLAVAVLYGHSLMFTLTRSGDGSRYMPEEIRLTCHLAVDLFFCISGYLILQSRERCSHWLSFCSKRFRRIVPGYGIALVVTVFAALAYRDPSMTAASYFGTVCSELPQMLTFGAVKVSHVYSGGHLPSELNAPLWTLRYEVACYAALALLWSCGFFKRRWLTVVLFATAFVLHPTAQHVVRAEFFSTFAQITRLTSWFAFGCALYLFRSEIPWTRKACLAALVLLISSWAFGAFEWTLPLLGFLTIRLGLYSRPIFAPITRYGDISYGVYILGWPVQQLLAQWGAADLGYVAFFLLTLLGVVPLASLSWRFAERPFIRRRSKATPNVDWTRRDLVEISA